MIDFDQTGKPLTTGKDSPKVPAEGLKCLRMGYQLAERMANRKRKLRGV